MDAMDAKFTIEPGGTKVHVHNEWDRLEIECPEGLVESEGWIQAFEVAIDPDRWSNPKDEWWVGARATRHMNLPARLA